MSVKLAVKREKRKKVLFFRLNNPFNTSLIKICFQSQLYSDLFFSGTALSHTCYETRSSGTHPITELHFIFVLSLHSAVFSYLIFFFCLVLIHGSPHSGWQAVWTGPCAQKRTRNPLTMTGEVLRASWSFISLFFLFTCPFFTSRLFSSHRLRECRV